MAYLGSQRLGFRVACLVSLGRAAQAEGRVSSEMGLLEEAA